jgi:hypothetical protein
VFWRRARRVAIDDGDRGWVARRVTAIVVLLAACIGGWGLTLGGAMAGGTEGSLMALAGLLSLVAGLLLALAAVALAPAWRVPQQRTLWLFRLAAAALLLAALLVFASASSLATMGLALVPALLALATWPRR